MANAWLCCSPEEEAVPGTKRSAWHLCILDKHRNSKLNGWMNG